VCRRPAPVSDDDPCPALDPETGICDLYEARPVIGRTFGPAVRGADGCVVTCEKCFKGATDEEIAACSTEIDWEGDGSGATTVAECLASSA
jgi:Fe-S-cluster containining protein